MSWSARASVTEVPILPVPGGLSEGLQRLDAAPLEEQSDWWKQLAADLEHGRLPPDSIELDFDILSRYFDGTTLGVAFIVSRVVGAKELLSFQDVSAVLVGHFGFLAKQGQHDALSDPSFRRLCSVLLSEQRAGADDALGDPDFRHEAELEQRTGTCKSMVYAVRRLRIGALLADATELKGQLYHYDYSDESISGSFVPSYKTQSHLGQGGRQSVTVVEQQRPCGENGCVDKYLFSDPAAWPGRVHWVHAHQPELRLLLALGQQHQLRSHIQGILSRLQVALPQLFTDGVNSQDASPPASCKCWSSMVLPAFYLDEAASDSLQRYRAWAAQQPPRAKWLTPRGKSLPPVVSMGVVHQNLAVLWTTSGQEQTAISVSTEATYLSKWDSAEPQHSKPVESALAYCRCCRRRAGGSEYKPLPQDEDADPEASGEFYWQEAVNEEVDQGLSVHEASAEAEQSASFERSFRDLLVQLGETNSPLRMGTHIQLVFRIVLCAISQCLDVISLYHAAIGRVQTLLRDKQQPQKEALIAKVSAARLELNTLLRMAEPFAETVLPKLRAEVLPTSSGSKAEDPLSSRIAGHHMVDIENNLHVFLRECRSLIQLCESLLNEYNSQSSDRVNKILNFLTVITFIIMPVQILTGLYGMNFKMMPELHWEYGYFYFFCLATISTAIFSACLFCAGHVIL